MVNTAELANRVKALPVLGDVLRWYANRFSEGSVVRIATGQAAGLMWRRHHRYVNGYWIGVYESALQGALARELKPGQVYYDVGANAGFFAVLASRLVGPKGRVFAFEPLPENADSVREQFQLNALSHCELVRAAVSNSTGQSYFVRAENNSQAHLSEDGIDPFSGERSDLVVRTTTVDEFASAHRRPNVIKIDVEGAEDLVLEGSSSVLNSDDAPTLIIELHGYQKAREVGRLLAMHDYRVCDLEGQRIDDVASQRHIVAYPAWYQQSRELCG
jgi:FkbM family methyltransferase